MRRVLAVALVLWTTSSSAWAQDARAIILFGTVRNTIGVALSGVDVWIDGTSVHVVTGDSGGFQFSAAPSGHVTVLARYAGFHPASKRVTMRPGDTKQVDLTLEGIPDALDTVLVAARLDSAVRLREFWARRTIGIGIFMTRADIERRRAQHSFDLFRGVMGIQVVTGTGESTKLVTTRRAASPMRLRSTAGAECPMQYYVDGIYMSSSAFSVDELTTDMIEAIEIFRGPSEVPAQFRQTDVDCGLVVIWTREPPRATLRSP